MPFNHITEMIDWIKYKVKYDFETLAMWDWWLETLSFLQVTDLLAYFCLFLGLSVGCGCSSASIIKQSIIFTAASVKWDKQKKFYAVTISNAQATLQQWLNNALWLVNWRHVIGHWSLLHSFAWTLIIITWGCDFE